MKRRTFTLVALLIGMLGFSQPGTIVKLPQPNKARGKTIMEAFALRASAKEFSSANIDLQDVADLLWAAVGINRPEIGKKTAPSAMNTQDVDVYLINKEGAYVYKPKEHVLMLVNEGDFRSAVAGAQKYFDNAALFLVMVSDTSRFKQGNASQKMQLAAMDAAIVSQNINLFCAGVGLKTRPRVYMEKDKLRKVLNLSDSQVLLMNNPVSK